MLRTTLPRAAARFAVLIAALLPLHAEWKALGPFGGSVQGIEIDPHHRDTVVASTANGLLFRSRDGGESWSALPFPAELRATLHTFMLDPVSPNTYFAGVSSESLEHAGVFRSRDAGATWEHLPGLRNQQVWSLAASPSDARVIAAGTETGLYITTDAGDTWRRISPDGDRRLQPVVSVAFDPTDSSVIYAGTPHLAWKTTDGGAVWKPIHAGMRDDSDIFSILVDRNQPERLFAGACSGIYRSINRGATWIKLNWASGASYRTYFVAQDPAQTNIVYAGTTFGLIQSLDGGTNWRRLSPHIARAMVFDTAHPGRIFVATEDAGVLRSDNGGLNLWGANRGLCSRHLSPLAASGESLFSSVLGEKTRRGGIRLLLTASLWNGAWDGSAWPEIRQVLTGAAGQIYALAGGSLRRSADGGRSWTAVAAPARVNAFLAQDPMIGGLLVSSETGVFRSEDSGLSWERLELPAVGSPIRELVALFSSATAAVAGSRILLSIDGTRWKIATELPENPEIYGLAGAAPGVLLAATSAGLMRSDDFGETWRSTGGDFRLTSIQAIARHPSEEHVYFAAAFGVAYESRDDGESWQRILPEGPAMGRITQLLPLPGEPERLFALTEGHGVFELDRKAPAAGASAASPAKF